MSYFELGGIQIPVECFSDFNQNYEELLGGASSLLRMSDGSLVKQTAWNGNKKLKVVTSGSGWAPLGLGGLNFASSLLLKCANPLAITDASNVILLPPDRRTDTDYIPIGFAVVNEQLIETPLVLSVDTATLDVVANATAYRVHYWPEITVFVKEPPEDWSKSGNSHGWSFEAEEI